MRLIALLALASACADDPNQVALDAARARWDASGIADYSVVFWYAYPGEPKVLLEIRSNQIVAATNVETGVAVVPDMFGPFHRVEDRFGMIQDGIDHDAISVHARYDDQLGYPTSVAIEWPSDAVDGPIATGMRDLQPLP